MTMRCSLLVTTYNWKEALAAVLASVRRQTRLPDEVVVAVSGTNGENFSFCRALLLVSASAPIVRPWKAP